MLEGGDTWPHFTLSCQTELPLKWDHEGWFTLRRSYKEIERRQMWGQERSELLGPSIGQRKLYKSNWDFWASPSGSLQYPDRRISLVEATRREMPRKVLHLWHLGVWRRNNLQEALKQRNPRKQIRFRKLLVIVWMRYWGPKVKKNKLNRGLWCLSCSWVPF